MSEVSGTLVVHSSDAEVLASLRALGDELTQPQLDRLLHAAGIRESGANDEEDDYLYAEDMAFIEGRDEQDGFLVLYVMGEEWIDIVQALLHSAQLRLWARLWHETGIDYFLASAQPEPFYMEVDVEGGDDPEALHVAARVWRQQMPLPVQAILADD